MSETVIGPYIFFLVIFALFVFVVKICNLVLFDFSCILMYGLNDVGALFLRKLKAIPDGSKFIM